MKRDPSCIFCKIVAGELPLYRVYEDDATLAFLTIEPVTRGHTLVIPKAHIPTVFDASSEEWMRVQESVRKIARAVDSALGADGVNINMNNREHAGQVIDHIHIHVIPRYAGDGITHWPHRPLEKDEGEEISKKIAVQF